MDSIIQLSTLVLLTVYTVATVALVRLTRTTVQETQRLARAQTTPKVVLYATLDPRRQSIIQLVAKNIGTAMAYDVRFEFSRPVPHRAFGLDTRSAEDVAPMSDGPLVNGIPTLAPGEERRLDWGQFPGLVRNLGEEPINATVYFTDGAEPMQPTRAVLEVESFRRTPSVESPESRTARQLEKIANAVERWRWAPIRVQVEPPPPDETLDDVEEGSEWTGTPTNGASSGQKPPTAS